MATVSRRAACQCGQLRIDTTGEPFGVSVCHCLDCQRRTGSVFGVQAGFRPAQVEVSGRYNDFSRVSDEADRKEHVFHFCPDCGSTVFSTGPSEPDVIAVSVGAFADPSFPAPTESGWDSRRHAWFELPGSMIGYDPRLWAPARPLYEAGRYEEAVAAGAALVEAHANQPHLRFNLACCESLAGRPGDAIEHLRQAIAMWEGCREMAREDPDFDPIREEPGFAELVQG